MYFQWPSLEWRKTSSNLNKPRSPSYLVTNRSKRAALSKDLTSRVMRAVKSDSKSESMMIHMEVVQQKAFMTMVQ